MIFVSEYSVISQEKYKPTRIFYKPFDVVYGTGKTEFEMRKEGFLIDTNERAIEKLKLDFEKGNPKPSDNHITDWFVNPQDNTIFVEYIEVEDAVPDKVTLEGEIETLKAQNGKLAQENLSLQLAVAELGATAEQDKIETQLAIAELASLLTGGEA